MWAKGWTFLFSLCCGIGAATSLPAQARLNELGICSAHFKARSDWLAELGKNEVTAEMFRAYSERLLDWAAADAPKPVDCRMMTYPFSTDCNPRHLAAIRDEAATAILTTFVENGYETAGLPTCIEDSVCTHCVDVLKGLPDDQTR